MSAKQEAEKWLIYGTDDVSEAESIIENLLKELEAAEQHACVTERKLAEAEKVVEAAKGLSIELNEWSDSDSIIGVVELKEALSDYEASKGE